jgi:hypothetical protein
VDLTAQHRDLVAQDQQLNILRAVITGELGQHLQDLAQHHRPTTRSWPRIITAIHADTSHKPHVTLPESTIRAPHDRLIG